MCYTQLYCMCSNSSNVAMSSSLSLLLVVFSGTLNPTHFTSLTSSTSSSIIIIIKY